MTIISYEQFKNLDLYQDFIRDNPDIGYLKVQAFTAYGAIPIPDTSILVTKDIEEYRVVFFQGKTDSSGMISNIALPAPRTVTATDIAPEYTIYDMTAVNEGYETLKTYSVGIFGGVNVIQYVKMTPKINLEGVDLNGN